MRSMSEISFASTSMDLELCHGKASMHKLPEITQIIVNKLCNKTLKIFFDKKLFFTFQPAPLKGCFISTID